MKKLFLTISIAVSLAGCAVQQTTKNVPEDYKKPILKYLSTALFDPASVKNARITRLREVQSMLPYSVVCIKLSANNRLGFTAPEKQIHFAFSRDGLFRGRGPDRMTDHQCKDAVFEPFPELEKLK